MLLSTRTTNWEHASAADAAVARGRLAHQTHQQLQAEGELSAGTGLRSAITICICTQSGWRAMSVVTITQEGNVPQSLWCTQSVLCVHADVLIVMLCRSSHKVTYHSNIIVLYPCIQVLQHSSTDPSRLALPAAAVAVAAAAYVPNNIGSSSNSSNGAATYARMHQLLHLQPFKAQTASQESSNRHFCQHSGGFCDPTPFGVQSWAPVRW